MKLTVIDNYNNLLITKAALERNMKDINTGKRFDHFQEGHDHYVKVISEQLSCINARLEALQK
ncbi:hypothetical protein FIP36_16980 [Salmonella enterica]|nr:hypothetical protein [Salmonella enterica]